MNTLKLKGLKEAKNYIAGACSDLVVLMVKYKEDRTQLEKIHEKLTEASSWIVAVSKTINIEDELT